MVFIFYAIHSLQIEKLEAVNKYEKEVDHVTRLKAEKDQMNEELKNLRTLEIQRDRDREAERLSDKKATREADREKEEYRMKLVRFFLIMIFTIYFSSMMSPHSLKMAAFHSFQFSTMQATVTYLIFICF